MELNRENFPKLFKAFEKYLIRVSNVESKIFESLDLSKLVNTGLLQYGSSVYFFDEVDIIVSVWNPGQGWKWRVSDIRNVTIEGYGKSRKECEQAAIKEACTRFEKI